MTTIKIQSLDRDIELLPYTRKISRAYKEALMRWVSVNTNQATDAKSLEMGLPVTNQLEAEEILVKGITGLSDADIDRLLNSEYEDLVKAVNSHIADKKK